MSIESRRNMDRRLKPIDALLDLWARWAADEFQKLGYPRVSILGKVIEWHELGIEPEKLNPPSEIQVAPEILLIDSLLPKLTPKQRTVTLLNYCMHAPIPLKARKCRMSASRFRSILEISQWSLATRVNAMQIEFRWTGGTWVMIWPEAVASNY